MCSFVRRRHQWGRFGGSSKRMPLGEKETAIWKNARAREIAAYFRPQDSWGSVCVLLRSEHVDPFWRDPCQITWYRNFRRIQWWGAVILFWIDLLVVKLLLLKCFSAACVEDYFNYMYENIYSIKYLHIFFVSFRWIFFLSWNFFITLMVLGFLFLIFLTDFFFNINVFFLSCHLLKKTNNFIEAQRMF